MLAYEYFLNRYFRDLEILMGNFFKLIIKSAPNPAQSAPNPAQSAPRWRNMIKEVEELTLELKRNQTGKETSEYVKLNHSIPVRNENNREKG